MTKNRDIYLKQLSLEDSEDCYYLLMHIGKSDNDFTNPVSEMNYAEFKSWIKQQCEWATGDNLPSGYVPQICYWLYVNERPVGIGKIRLGLTPQSRLEGGNIGYAIDSRCRGNGYGTQLLDLLILKVRELNVEEVLITIKKFNYASKRVAERNDCVPLYETESWWYYTINK